MPDLDLRVSDVPVFSLAERDRRWTLARDFMDREGLDAMLVFGEHEDAGPAPFSFDAWFTNDRAGTTVLFQKTGDLTVFVPIATYIYGHKEAARRGDSSWITPGDFRMGRDSGAIAGVLETRGLGRAKIGVVGLEPYIPWHPEGIVPYPLWNSLLSRFPDAEFRPSGVELARLMMPLSDEEIAVVRCSAMIGDAMARAMVEAARPGVSEAEVYAAAMAAAATRGTVVPGMHFWTGPAPAASGPPQWAYRPQAPRVLQNGDYITTELFSNFGMCLTQHQVAIAVGDVHEDFQRAELVVRDCYNAGLELLRVGARFGDIAEAMLAPLEAAGGWVRGPQIHGLNPYGAMCRTPEDPNLAAEGYPDVASAPTQLADMQLEPGMTFSLEPSCGLGRHIVTIGGTVVVGEDGPIELSPYTARVLRRGA